MGTFDFNRLSLTRYWKRRMYSRGELRMVMAGGFEFANSRRKMKADGRKRKREHQMMKRLRRLRAPSISNTLYREGSR